MKSGMSDDRGQIDFERRANKWLTILLLITVFPQWWSWLLILFASVLLTIAEGIVVETWRSYRSGQR